MFDVVELVEKANALLIKGTQNTVSSWILCFPVAIRKLASLRPTMPFEGMQGVSLEMAVGSPFCKFPDDALQ